MRKDNINNPSTNVTIDTPEALGAFLRATRREAGLTQEEAAGLCNVGTRFLNEIEHGKSTAALGKVMQVLRGYGIRLHGTRRSGSLPVKES
jgi:transcriptional regulator with XRE-family HTH domain